MKTIKANAAITKIEVGYTSASRLVGIRFINEKTGDVISEAYTTKAEWKNIVEGMATIK